MGSTSYTSYGDGKPNSIYTCSKHLVAVQGAIVGFREEKRETVELYLKELYARLHLCYHR